MFAQRRGLRHVRWSYEQLVLTARRIARELESHGIAKGERVLLCGENSPEWVAAFWGCLLRGAVVVPLDKESTDQFVISVRQQTDAKLVMASSRVAVIERLAAGGELLNVPLLTLDEQSEMSAPHSSEPYPFEGVDESTLVEIIFTSGTTSTPKGVLLTHGNLLANLLPIEAEIRKYVKWERFFHPLRFLNLVPLSHVFGQFMGIFVPQLLGAEVHFHDTLNPAEILRRTRESRISVIVTVPRVLDSLREWVERNHAARDRLSTLEERIAAAKRANFLRRWWMFRHVHRDFGWKFWAFLSGGATLDQQTETFWRRLGFAVLQGYGMTETASLISVTHPFKGVHGSIGKLMPGYEVKLDETGEIIVRGASVSPGYWTAAGRINRTPDDWLHTGDMGELDDAGNLSFKGRKKDVVVTAAGLNIYPEDLEEAINRQPEVRASCVIKWSSTHGIEPLAVLILRDSTASAEAAIERANQSLAEHQRIRRWYVWMEPDFPRTVTYKVIKGEVAARIKDEFGRIKDETKNSQSSLITDPSASSSFILSAAARISGHAPSGEGKPTLKLTTDLKLDSLGRIELLSALEERYQIDIDEAAFTAATTVEEVERIVRGEMEERAVPYPYPKWSRRFPLTWIRALLTYILILPLTRVMSRMRVEGRRHVAGLGGPALFVANHVTLADHALILTALPARLRHRLAIAMEGERLRDWLHPSAGTSCFVQLRLLIQYFLVITFFQVFPLPRRSGFRRSFAYAGRCVDRGDSVLVFPEGERAPLGQMHMSSFKTGIGLLAKELNVPVVPVRLHGLYELKQRQKYFAPPGVVRVVFGEPIKFDRRLKPAAIAEELERRIAAL
ncbi:MAG: AMP-binding protein [Pyrinomonadaceae bacterium]|nr:AMP-binding protein [Pyrinomonadaceae bacterium]